MIEVVRRQVPKNVGLRERKKEEDWKIERYSVLLRHYSGDEIKKEETGNTMCKHGKSAELETLKGKRRLGRSKPR
jgi:hypothetical protein